MDSTLLFFNKVRETQLQRLAAGIGLIDLANEDFEGAGGPEIITLDDEDESPDGQSGEEDVKDLALLPSHLVIDQDWSEEDHLVFEAFS